jgi:high affinity Mn2+ porin
VKILSRAITRLHLWRGFFPALGVQYIVHPGYNRDRGPVIVPSIRLHVEF